MLFFRRKAWISALAGLAGLTLSPAAQAMSLDDAVLAELNHARAHPAEYARELRRDPDAHASDDRAALEEAIDFLERQQPLAPLDGDRRVAAAAREHVRAQATSGSVGHGAAGGLGRRLRDNGVWAGLSAENISYGSRTATDVIRQLIIDSGVPNRGHRQNIFSRGYQLAGVACGPHPAYDVVCVIDFAGALPPR
jgi:uncharacterized protein YkwD